MSNKKLDPNEEIIWGKMPDLIPEYNRTLVKALVGRETRLPAEWAAEINHPHTVQVLSYIDVGEATCLEVEINKEGAGPRKHIFQMIDRAKHSGDDLEHEEHKYNKALKYMIYNAKGENNVTI